MPNAFVEMVEAARSGPIDTGRDSPLPASVRIAADSSGEIKHLSAEGTVTTDPSAARIAADSIFQLASCTKLVTSIAVLQCVEKGLLDLDDDVAGVLPEWSMREILTGFDEAGEPVLRKSEEKMTVRHLLTHSSGMAYDLASLELMRWWKWKGEDPSLYEGMIDKAYRCPLIFAPDSGWYYSPGIDWAGVMVSRVTGSSLSAYMQTNIFAPLGITTAAFRLSDYPPDIQDGSQSRRVSTALRTPSGDLAPCPPTRNLNPRDDLGGGGLSMSPADYIKILISLLRNDGTLLGPDTATRLVFTPQLSPGAKASLSTAVEPSAPAGAMFRSGVDGHEWDHSLCGLLNMDDVEGMCRQGTLSWSGIHHVFWWIDRGSGLCGIYASQVMPPNDKTTLDAAVGFRKEMFRRFAQ